MGFNGARKDSERSRLKEHGARLYRIWSNMKYRCNKESSKDYSRYGARGIKVCNEWNGDFTIFYKWALGNGYDNDLQLDRTDNDSDYCPENCRWATIAEQANNRRTNHFIEIDGETRTIREWEVLNGLGKNTILNRLLRGYSGGDLIINKLERKHVHVKPAAKLTAEQVTEINGLIGTMTYGEIAERYGVKKWTIKDIKSGKTWSDITGRGRGN